MRTIDPGRNVWLLGYSLMSKAVTSGGSAWMSLGGDLNGLSSDHEVSSKAKNLSDGGWVPDTAKGPDMGQLD